MWMRNGPLTLLALLVMGGSWGGTAAADWPQWRATAERSAATSEPLPAELQLRWIRQYAPRQQAWDDTLNLDLMTYDKVFEPVAADGRLFVGFNDRDKVVAFDLATGRELWTCYTSGPVRLAPACAEGLVFFVSDDGHLYCVRAADGAVQWTFRGGPNGRLAIGNRRLISAWPARGGPVVRDGVVYFSASIWPFMGTYIYALKAETGDVVWINDETGASYIKQPHSAPSFAGVAPQGALVATADRLILPGGRSVPSVLDRHTGRELYFHLNAGGKGVGGSFVAASHDSWFVHTRGRSTREYSLDKGEKTGLSLNEPVIAGDLLYSAEVEKGQPVIRAWDRRRQKGVWELSADGRGDLILAGDTLYAVGAPTEAAPRQSQLTAIRLPQKNRPARVIWQGQAEGTVERLLAASQHLIAVTREGGLQAWGADSTQQPALIAETVVPLGSDATATQPAEELLSTGDAEGYALWIGAADDPLVVGMVAQSPFLELSIFDPNAARVAAARRRFDQAGTYGRVTVHLLDRDDFQPPPYVAHRLFVARDQSQQILEDGAYLAKLYESVRPYGGTLQLLVDPQHAETSRRQVQAMSLDQAEVDLTPFGVRVRKTGPLPGAGEWTHQYGNVANTVKSDDSRVRLPLGVLWFGGSSHDDVLPRHGHGPPEQVVGGRLIIQGMNLLTARDVYTGRVLWKREFPDLGTYDVYFDATYKETPLDTAYNQVHIPGANGRGTNYVVTADRVYLIAGNRCEVLDSATGATVTSIALPQDDPAHPREWGYIGVYDDVLIGGVGFAEYRNQHQIPDAAAAIGLSTKATPFGLKSLDRAASRALVGFNRHTGEQLWKVDARHSFWHNGIVAGNGKVYALDRNPKPVEDYLRRRGQSDPATYRILAFDVHNGETSWERSGDVFGTWLSYSAPRDLLLQAGAAASDRLSSEVNTGMAVYRGHDGFEVWKHTTLRYSGPCVLHDDLIITNANSYAESAGAFSLLDGSPQLVVDPVTGVLKPWKLTRAYGCNSIIASQNLLTFRSGAAGFYDLLSQSGTGNFGGFKSGCTSNLVVADGVLNAPDYTRTCSCSYQNQTSLALVHMPDIDAWTISSSGSLIPGSGRVRQLGLNFGAPGDRRDPLGVMWLEYPPVSSEPLGLDLQTNPEAIPFQHHPSAMRGSPLPWVAASGLDHLTHLRLALQPSLASALKSGWAIAAPDDDAEESRDGSLNLISSRLELGVNDGPQLVGLRFNNLPLRRGAKVQAAALQFVCNTPDDQPTELVIRAEAVGNAAPFLDKRGHLSSRKLTESKVFWTVPAWKKENDAGDAQRSPDLTSLVREVINRSDWQPGNSIVFVISGTGQRVAPSYRGESPPATRLMLDAETVEPRQTGVPYRVKLHFGAPRGLAAAPRAFDVRVQGELQPVPVQLAAQDGGAAPFQTLTIERVLLEDHLDVQFLPRTGAPLLSGIELHRLDE